MTIAQVVGLAVYDFLDFFRQRINETSRRESHVNLVLLFFSRGRGTADLKCLALLATGRVRPTGGFVILREQRERTVRLGQSVRMQIAAIVGDELLNTRSRDLRDQG